MTAPAKLALFALALLIVFASAVGVGRAFGPSNNVATDHDRHPAPSAVTP